MDKRTIIALVIIGAIFLLWPTYMKKFSGVKSPPPAQVTEQTDVAQTPAVQDQTAQPEKVVREPVQRPVVTQRQTDPAAPSGDVEFEMVDVETNLFKGTLSSAGGGTIISWKLKNYLGRKGDWVELIPDSAKGNLDISLGGHSDMSVYSFETVLNERMTENGVEMQRIVFGRDLPNGVRIEKEFILQDDRYDIDLRVRLIGVTRQTAGMGFDILWGSGLYPTETRIEDDNPYYQAYALQGDELLKTKDKSTGVREGNTRWTAVRTKYFVVATIPKSKPGVSARLEGTEYRMQYAGEVKKWKQFSTRLTMPLQGLSEEASDFSVYLGPIDYVELKNMNYELERMMNMGWAIIRPFSIAFFHVLQFLNGILGNYGWSIIVFAILIKIVLYPLTRKSFQSMRKMQELQPKMNALKEKYKNDPQKMNQETMKLYKQHGVNPMGGCLPLLLQMPVLFALFNLFRTTIMLRQAPFLGGLIADLSAPDAIIGNINVLPILMGATMILQQKLSSQNPQQKMMAYMMPVFFTFMFYKFSAGLNLYYLMFNVLTIAQELLIKRQKEKPDTE